MILNFARRPLHWWNESQPKENPLAQRCNDGGPLHLSEKASFAEEPARIGRLSHAKGRGAEERIDADRFLAPRSEGEQVRRRDIRELPWVHARRGRLGARQEEVARRTPGDERGSRQIVLGRDSKFLRLFLIFWYHFSHCMGYCTSTHLSTRIDF